jgi:DNA-binding NarL/FixJ family response regulator
LLYVARQLRVLVIEDNRLMREGITALVAAQPVWAVVGAAAAAEAGLRILREAKPHVVLLDGALGETPSHGVVKRIRKEAPESRVVVMDLLPGQEDGIAFAQAGANGFILKAATTEDFVGTIRSVAEGVDVVPPALTGTLLAHIAGHAVSRDAPGLGAAVRLTPREREIMALIAEGLSNKEIAQRLRIAIHTVKSHVHNILEKLALHSRLQVAARAHQADAPRTDPSSPSRPPGRLPPTS